MVDLLLTLQPRTGFNAAKLAYFLLTNKKMAQSLFFAKDMYKRGISKQA